MRALSHSWWILSTAAVVACTGGGGGTGPTTGTSGGTGACSIDASQRADTGAKAPVTVAPFTFSLRTLFY